MLRDHRKFAYQFAVHKEKAGRVKKDRPSQHGNPCSSEVSYGLKTNLQHFSKEIAFARHQLCPLLPICVTTLWVSMFSRACKCATRDVSRFLPSDRSGVGQLCPHRVLPTSDRCADGTDVERDHEPLGGVDWYTPSISYPYTLINLII